MHEPSITVTPHPGGELVFDVIVCDPSGETRHRVTIEANEAERWAKLGAAPSRCVEAVMRFLLDREPKESILNAFDMRVVRRYFPELDDAFPRYLVRPGGEPGRK
ncbi:MAG: hypothetical protein WCF81_09900 [Roseiarcus sp.]